MKFLTKEQALAILEQPNGSEKLFARAEEAFPAAWGLFEEAGDARAAAFLARCAKRKAFSEKMNASLGEERAALRRALASDEPKLRKNAAKLAGELGEPEDVRYIAEALRAEQTRFVRPAMILALGAIGTIEAEDALASHAVPPAESEAEKRHFEEETAALMDAKKRFLSLDKHGFTGLSRPYKAVLRAPEMLAGSLALELDALGIPHEKPKQNAIELATAEPAGLFACRSFFELLFPIGETLMNPKSIAIMAAPFMKELLTRAHAGEPPFGYRIELRNEGAELDRAGITKAAAALIDCAELVNSPGDYEAELRIEPRKNGAAALYLKLYTIEDSRFSYRKAALPASIHPATAAAIMRYAMEHLHEGARVLDPCCGSGTMLFEREKLLPPLTLTGVDIAHKAIDIARENAKAGGSRAKFVCNDMRRFEAERPFDEIIANLPFGNRVGSHKDNMELYAYLLDALPRWLARDGVAILYTMEFTLLKKLVRERPALRLLTETRTEAGGLMPGIFIIKRA